MRSTVRRRTATLLGLTVLTVGGGLVASQQPLHEGALPLGSQVPDTDGDGVDDEDELAGWHTWAGTTFVTDPDDPDSDDDGLGDGAEAGPLSVTPGGAGVAYAGRSDPTSWDTDGDWLDDATEVDARLDVWSVDTDGDGLEDLEEIEFGSDPLTINADGDHLDDAQELTEGTDPFTYDLTREEGIRAFLGDIYVVNELSAEQRDSWQYLLGAIAREFGVSDAIRIAQSIISLDPRKAVEAFVKAIPVAGDAAAVVDTALDFATRGRAAARAASYLLARSGLLDDGARLTTLEAVLRRAGDTGRLDQDLLLHGSSAPPALLTTRWISARADLNARKDVIVGDLAECAYTDIRVNQQQVDSAGLLVGENRPDIQATSPTGAREHWVIDSDPAGTGRLHELRILANDPASRVHVVTEAQLMSCVD